jgi:hypothetical protein
VGQGGNLIYDPGLVRACVTVVFAVLALAGCGSGGADTKRVAEAAGKCTDRMFQEVTLSRAPAYSPVPETQLRTYLAITYCGPFASKGWVHDDGSLRIDAQWWLVRGHRNACGAATPGGTPKVVPCGVFLGSEIDCALLHFVRRSEVRRYIAELPAQFRNIRCDDGTPPDELGVP